MKAGVVDPAKVTRTALQDAASIAGLLRTTERMSTEIPEKNATAAALDTGRGRNVMALFRKNGREKGRAVICVMHDHRMI